MGYTHYFELKKDLTGKVLDDINKVLNKYPELRYECDSDEPPVVSKEYIRFNGYEEDGYETFFLEPNRSEFCKTNERHYDLPVCEVLLVLKHHYGDDFELSSDGFWVSEKEFEKRELDGNWELALENVKSDFGYNFTFNGIEDEGYYNFEIGR